MSVFVDPGRVPLAAYPPPPDSHMDVGWSAEYPVVFAGECKTLPTGHGRAYRMSHACGKLDWA